jgi:Flp pilus assembly protein TadD
MAVTLPLALILLDFWPLQRFQFPPAAGWRRRELMLGVEKIPFGVMALISSLVTVYAQKKGGELIPLSNLPLLSRPANAVLGYVTYLSKTFWPAKLTVFYPYLLGFTVTGVMGAFLLLGGMSVLGILQARQRPWLLFGWFWFLGLLIPVIGLIQVGMQSVADRYMYLPSIGLFVVVVWEVERRCSGLAGGRKVRVVLNAAVLAGCLTMTTRQLGYWQNSITLAQRTLQVTQENYVAYDSLGRAYIELGEPERAVPFCTEAVKLNPDWPQGQFSLGLALSQTGQTNDAIQHFEAGLARTPGFAAGRLRLGQILQQFGRMDEAMAQFAEALRLDPGLLDAQISWGITLAMQKKIPEAIVHFSEAARLEPDNPEIEFDLGLALLDSHQPAAASVRFTKALQFTPSETKVHYRLAQSLQQQNQLAEAALHYREALRLTPDFPEAKAALDAILASNPEFKAGIGR